jgi:NADPH2:quinone reductase
MKAIQVHAFGGPEVLELKEIETPKPGKGEVLVKVKAAGVNPYDTYMRAGTYAIKPNLPYTPGSDAAGVIEVVGEGVTNVKKGDRVYTAKTISGAYAEYALALDAQVFALPEKISFAQGAGVWVPYGTAFTALEHHGFARAGETLLIHGASGGVGTAAIQFGVARGLTVFGTAGSERGLELIRKEGVSRAFNHTQAGYTDEIMKAMGGKGVDVILEMAAHLNMAADLKMLAMNGRMVVIGNRGDITITPRDLMARRGTATGFTLWAATEQEWKEMHAAIGAGLENGTLRPVVGKTFALKDAAKAHEEVLKPGAAGKIVLEP